MMDKTSDSREERIQAINSIDGSWQTITRWTPTDFSRVLMSSEFVIAYGIAIMHAHTVAYIYYID